MREIEFRVWDTWNNAMWCWEALQKFAHLFIKMIKLDDGRYIIEQYTGKKDKKGKSIFDGDILFGREEGNGETTAWVDIYYIVFFNNKYGRWQVREKQILEDSCWCDDLVDVIDEYEVVGTIHDKDKS